MPRRVIRVSTINCGRRCGCVHAISSLVEDVFEQRGWDIIWFSELDGVHGANSFLDGVEDAFLPHKFLRHYGGTGNTACGFLVHCRVVPLMRSISWQSRSGGILLKGSGIVSLMVIGVHGQMHADAKDTISEVALHLSSSRQHDTQLCCVGDFNIDLSWTLPDNSREDVEPDSIRNARSLLAEFSHRVGAEINYAKECESLPGGPFNVDCLLHPYTRLPIGDLTLLHRPSLLDYSLCTRGTSRTTWLDWEGVPADHAAFGVTVAWNHAVVSKPKTHWNCSSEEAALAWIESSTFRSECDSALCELSFFKKFCLQLQSTFACNHSRSQRRAQRLSPQLRDMYARISMCTNEEDRQLLQISAFEVRKKCWEIAGNRIICAKIKKGGVVTRSKKLHTIKSVRSDSKKGVQGTKHALCTCSTRPEFTEDVVSVGVGTKMGT